MLQAQRLSSACVCTRGWPVAIGSVQLCSRQVQPRQPSCDHGRLCPLGAAGAQLDGSIAHGALLLILWAEQRRASVSAIALGHSMWACADSCEAMGKHRAELLLQGAPRIQICIKTRACRALKHVPAAAGRGKRSTAIAPHSAAISAP